MLDSPPPLPTSPPPDFSSNKPQIYFQCITPNGLHPSKSNSSRNGSSDLQTKSPDSAFGSEASVDNNSSGSQSNSSSHSRDESSDQYLLPDCRLPEDQQNVVIFEPRPSSNSIIPKIQPTPAAISTLKSSWINNTIQKQHKVKFKEFNAFEKSVWLNNSQSHGFIRFSDPTSNLTCSLVVPCTLESSCSEITAGLGLKSDVIHVQYGGDIIRRLQPNDRPLSIQNIYLDTIGVKDEFRRREMGDFLSLGWMIRFFAGRPFIDDGFGCEKLSAICNVRKGRVFHHWSKRLCVLNGTRIIIYQGEDRTGSTDIILLSRAKVEEVHLRSRGRCIKISVSSSRKPLSSVYLSFDNVMDLNAWIARCVKAAARVPPICDLSSLQLESLPEQVFCVGSERLLTQLNLRHNNLKEKRSQNCSIPCGLDDLCRLQSLRSLNLADNSLTIFPSVLLNLPALTELNLSSNKIELIPEAIGNLKSLQSLIISNNILSFLPSHIIQCKTLNCVDISFNRFSSVPFELSALPNLNSWIVSGNKIEIFEAPKSAVQMTRLDLRHNDLSNFGGQLLETLKNLTMLDLRDNPGLKELDLTSLHSLQIFHCERTSVEKVLFNGKSLTSINLRKNNLKQMLVTPIPLNLKTLDVSSNKLVRLPDWLTELDQLESINASKNQLNALPQRLFLCSSLRVVRLSQNRINELPEQIENCFIEELYLHHNKLTYLPPHLLLSTHKLRVLNLSQNYLTSLPSLNPFTDLNKVQQLFLAANRLTDASLQIVTQYRRLRLLDMSYNYIEHITTDIFWNWRLSKRFYLLNLSIEKLASLEDLNLSGNRISHLPAAIAALPNLAILRVHSNRIFSIPNFSQCKALKLLDIGNNQIEKIDISYFLAPSIKHLDLACNQRLHLNANAFNDINRMISLVDMSAENGAKAEKVMAYVNDNVSIPWYSGFAESSGTRNKLCIGQIREPYIGGETVGGLFGIIDGGLSDQITTKLTPNLLQIFTDELKLTPNCTRTCLYNTFLTAHRSLEQQGQTVGASCALVYITCCDKNGQSQMRADCASVGHSEVVLCRGGKAVTLTKTSTISRDDKDEYDRVKQCQGILTEANELDGMTSCSRLLGCSFLYPKVIPTPNTLTIKLHHSDEFIIIGSKGLWEQVSHTEAVTRVRNIANPIQAAKHLQDIARGYGYSENLSVLVIRLHNGAHEAFTEFQDSQLPKSLRDARLRLEARSASNVCDLEDGGASTDDEIRSEPRRPPKERPNYYFMYKTNIAKNQSPTCSSSTISEASESASESSTNASESTISDCRTNSPNPLPIPYDSDPMTIHQTSCMVEEMDMDEPMLDANSGLKLSRSMSSLAQEYPSLECLKTAAIVTNFSRLSPSSPKTVTFKENQGQTCEQPEDDVIDQIRLVANREKFENAKKFLMDKLSFPNAMQ